VAVADFSGVCSGDIYVLKPKGKHLLPELLPFICQTDAFFEHAVGTSAGSLSPRTNWNNLADFGFALPPIEEQRRIFRTLAASERLIDSLRSLLDHTRISQAATFGSLTLGMGNRVGVDRFTV
jgi:type I restriction enzyme S subunit